MNYWGWFMMFTDDLLGVDLIAVFRAACEHSRILVLVVRNEHCNVLLEIEFCFLYIRISKLPKYIVYYRKLWYFEAWYRFTNAPNIGVRELLYCILYLAVYFHEIGGDDYMRKYFIYRIFFRMLKSPLIPNKIRSITIWMWIGWDLCCSFWIMTPSL